MRRKKNKASVMIHPLSKILTHTIFPWVKGKSTNEVQKEFDKEIREWLEEKVDQLINDYTGIGTVKQILELDPVNWCEHIKYNVSQYNCHHNNTTWFVTEAWNQCPICGAKRP